MRIGLAADHGGFALKQSLLDALADSGHELVDFGATEFDPQDDYPDFVIPLARAVAAGEIDRGIVICGSGVGACFAANKVARVRAALITEVFSARQGVEDDDMNVICLGGRVLGSALALELVRAFLAAEYLALPRYERRLEKVRQLETGSDTDE
ncbi:MAG: RpiB/LacA/LacB family sugar-phosphate isomerase [Armatimonadota bacterium]|jgi:ribose 5-phosphate isomerase B